MSSLRSFSFSPRVNLLLWLCACHSHFVRTLNFNCTFVSRYSDSVISIDNVRLFLNIERIEKGKYVVFHFVTCSQMIQLKPANNFVQFNSNILQLKYYLNFARLIHYWRNEKHLLQKILVYSFFIYYSYLIWIITFKAMMRCVWLLKTTSIIILI